MGEAPDLARIEALTAELARTLAKAKQLSVAVSRERYVRILTGKLHAPARLFDTALTEHSPTVCDPEPGRPLGFENPAPWPAPSSSRGSTSWEPDAEIRDRETGVMPNSDAADWSRS